MMPWFLFHTNYSLITKLMDVQSKKKKEKKKLQASIIDLQNVFVFISVTQIKVITFAM